MLSLRERIELDLKARLMGETLVLNRSLDPLYGDYIKLNDLNVPLELKRDQVDDLMPTIKEVVENMEGYREQDMGDIILREPFYKDSCVEARRLNHLETSNTSPLVPPPTQQIPHTVSSIKLPILQKGEYDIWAIKMEHYFEPHRLSNMEKGLRKGYDRFQTLLSQLEIHGAGVSHEDANQKFLRSLPSSWSQVALIMRTKPGLDTLSFDDLYNNLRVFERDVKGTTASSSNTQNVPFMSADNTSSTNDVSTAYNVSSSAPQLDYDDLEQIHDDDMEEMDLKWQFDNKDPVGFDKTKVECFNCHKIRHFARDCRAKGNQDSRRRDAGYNGNKTRDNGTRPASHDDSKALVTIDGEDIDWSGHVEEDAQNYAMMAYSSSNSGSDNEASDLEDTSVNDRYADGMHAVSPPITGNYMPSGPDIEIDYFKFTYGPKQTSVDESDSKPSEYASYESDSSVEITTSMTELVKNAPKDDPHRALNDKGIVDSGCSRHMTGNKAHLANYQEFKGGSIVFGGSNRRITGKGKIKAGRLDFEDVYYVEELKHFNLFSLPDENQVLLKIPKQHNMYNFNLKNIDPSGDLACFFAKASINESNKWHKRLGHVSFKNLNKLVKGNLVRGLPFKIFENDHTCFACQKGKQHKASYSFLPTTFWAAVVNTACYVLNRLLVTKPQNKTPYELLTGKGHEWLFDLDYLTNSMNYDPVLVENQAKKCAGPKEANNSASTQANDDQSANLEEINLHEEHFVLHIWSAYSTTVKSLGDKIEKDIGFKTSESLRKKATHDIQNANTSSTNLLNTVSTPLSTAG
nr:hypothetical protein [Tanacetum cinerariifolium]